jgi:ribonuclease HI
MECSPDDVQFFTDGSCIDGGVGAAAVMYKDRIACKTICKHIGSEKEHTVFGAELVGVIMGAHMARMERAEIGVTVGMDNQAAMKATTHEKQKLGQYLIDILQRKLGRNLAQGRGECMTLRWIPGHKGKQA